MNTGCFCCYEIFSLSDTSQSRSYFSDRKFGSKITFLWLLWFLLHFTKRLGTLRWKRVSHSSVVVCEAQRWIFRLSLPTWYLHIWLLLSPPGSPSSFLWVTCSHEDDVNWKPNQFFFFCSDLLFIFIPSHFPEGN